MSTITTHVLDTSRGRPAVGVPVRLERRAASDAWNVVGAATTDDDGRVRALLSASEALVAGEYQLTFDTDAYFRLVGIEAFYPAVVVRFAVRDSSQHHHVPLLLSPFGYSTYRGS